MTGDVERPAVGPILVFGSGGMLGNALLRDLTRRGLAVVGTMRRAPPIGDRWFAGLNILTDVDLRDDSALVQAIETVSPHWMINCAAVRSAAADDGTQQRMMTAINAELPHRLTALSAGQGARLIHVSTDGVFDGTAAPHDERSTPSPADPYGVSKLVGEPSGDHALTLRLSLIGCSPVGRATLVDWILGLPRGAAIAGYSRAVFSGLPVHEVARFIADHVLARPAPPSGVLHLAGPPISKAALIPLVLARAGRSDVCVRDDETVVSNRTLTSIRDDALAGYRAPPWPRMIDDMFDFYAQLGLAA